jgi:hypothetical protein
MYVVRRFHLLKLRGKVSEIIEMGYFDFNRLTSKFHNEKFELSIESKSKLVEPFLFKGQALYIYNPNHPVFILGKRRKGSEYEKVIKDYKSRRERIKRNNLIYAILHENAEFRITVKNKHGKFEEMPINEDLNTLNAKFLDIGIAVRFIDKFKNFLKTLDIKERKELPKGRFDKEDIKKLILDARSILSNLPSNQQNVIIGRLLSVCKILPFELFDPNEGIELESEYYRHKLKDI